MKLIKIFLILTIFVALFYVLNKKIIAIECSTDVPLTSTQAIADFEDQCIRPLGLKKSSLSDEIQYIDNQIYVTTQKIQDTEQKIIDTGHEIDVIGTRIDGLNQSLDYISKLLLNRIVIGYKQRSLSLFSMLFDTVDAGDLLTKIKYQKTTQDNDQKLLVQVQEAKSNFEEQKTLREQKKTELDQLTVTLQSQKVSLKNQQDAKQILLTETQNSESVYENKVAQARQNLAGEVSFATAAGGGLTTFGSGSNGWYYTQRDPAWGNIILPGSSSSVLYAGCAVSSVAMVCKSYGQNITPATIAYNPSNFIGGDLWNWAFSCSGKSTDPFISYPSQDQVKSYVNSNTPVILRLISPSVSGLHFVVAWKWDGSDFIIHDPFYGPDKKFSERYNWSQVTTAIAIH